MMAAMKKRASKTPVARGPDPLAEVVRTKLLALGEYGHLHVRRQGTDVVIEQPGSPDAPEERDPVLRLTPIGGYQFGLSLRRNGTRWEKVPVSGVLADVLAQAVPMFGPWLAPDVMGGTSGMDY